MYPRTQAMRRVRREQAEVRNAAWRALSDVQKIAILRNDRPGRSKKQLARLGVGDGLQTITAAEVADLSRRFLK